MEVNTQYFGTVSCAKEDLIHFPEGLYGFQQYKSYIPLAFQEDSDALICLQSVEEYDISFIVMNPFLLDPDYSPVLSADDKTMLDATQNEDTISYYVISVIHDSMEDSTVNLKCPIAVNAQTRMARQVILDNPLYQIRHKISSFGKKGG